jgi:hypothetical protein
LVRRPERFHGDSEPEYLVQLFPTGASAARRYRVHLRRRIVFDEQHAEQNEMSHFDVEYVRIERMRAQLLRKPEKLRIDLAREFETRAESGGNVPSNST